MEFQFWALLAHATLTFGGSLISVWARLLQLIRGVWVLSLEQHILLIKLHMVLGMGVSSSGAK